jgi:hypothetical protein
MINRRDAEFHRCEIERSGERLNCILKKDILLEKMPKLINKSVTKGAPLNQD